MFSFLTRVLDWFKSLFWKEEMELTLVGLQYSGKTTFVNVIGKIENCSGLSIVPIPINFSLPIFASSDPVRDTFTNLI